MVSIVMSLNVPWPSTVRTILVGVSSVISVSSHSDSIHCSTDNQSIAEVFYGTLLGTVLLPFVFVLITWVYWFVFVPACPICGCAKKIKTTPFCKIKLNPFKEVATPTTPTTTTTNSATQWKSNRDGWIATNVYFIYIVFPSVIRMCFETFQCKNVCGALHMVKDDKEICWLANSRHLNMALGVAVPSLVLYLIMLPTLTLVYLWTHRNVMLTDRKLMLRFGLLFSGYTRKRWYWEALVNLRKIALIVIVTFGQESQSQLHFALGTLILVLYSQERGHPFTEDYSKEKKIENTVLDKNSSAAKKNWHKLLNLSTMAKNKAAIAEHAQQQWLHLMEVASLLVLVTMVWSSVFFTLRDNACKNSSALGCTMLSVVVLASNVIFVVVCSVSFIKSFAEKSHVVQKVIQFVKHARTSVVELVQRTVGGPGRASGSSHLRTNVPVDFDDLSGGGGNKHYRNPLKEVATEKTVGSGPLKKQHVALEMAPMQTDEVVQKNQRARFQAHKDVSGRTYYENINKPGEVSWKLPDDAVCIAAPVQVAAERKSKKQVWRAHRDASSGREYYHSVDFGTTTWDMPEGEDVEIQ